MAKNNLVAMSSDARIVNLPYSSRRVLVLRDHVFEHVPDGPGVGRALGGAAKIAGGVALLGVGGPALILWGVVDLLEATTHALRKLAVRTSEVAAISKGIPRELRVLPAEPGGTLLVPLELAAQQLAFSPGHPQTDCAYVGHPLVPDRYIPMEFFHAVVFEEKVCELLRVLASLGAVRTRVTCREGYSRQVGGSAGAAFSKDVTAEVSAASTESREKYASFEEHYDPVGDPRLPKDLVWFDHEPSWVSLATRRLDHGITKFRAELRYEDSFGIDGTLKAGVDKLGVRASGKFHDFALTRWEFEGEFRALATS